MYCFCTYNSEVSVIYAYDIEHMESICAEVFPGNSIDARSYPLRSLSKQPVSEEQLESNSQVGLSLA